MTQINTISEFLLHAGTNYRIFDLGRAIRPLESQLFLDIELGRTAAPYPRQQHAWLGIVFFQPGQNQQHYIWFIKLPLDEQGFIVAASRQHFLQMVVDALGLQLDKTSHQQLPDNPYTFIPSQQQLADFNSISRTTLGLPPSQYFEHALQYLQNPQQGDWQTLSVQGIADLVAFMHQKDLETSLISQFQHLAYEVQLAICHSFENHSISLPCAEMLVKWGQLATNDPTRCTLLLRALSQSQQQDLVAKLIQQLLQQDNAMHQDIFIVIAARHWQTLHKHQLIESYMQQLADFDTNLFSALYRDLVQIPDMRQTMLAMLNKPGHPASLASALEQLIVSQQR